MKRRASNAASPFSTPSKRPRTAIAVIPMADMNVDTAHSAVVTRDGRRRGRTSVKQRGRKLNRKQKGEVKRLIALRQELKFWGQVLAATSMTTTNATVTLSAIPQGDTDSSRDGDRLMWCGTAEFNYQVVNGQGATGDVYNNTRIVIYQWHPSSTPNGTQILLNGPSGAVDIYSVYNHDYRQLYTILYDSNDYTVGNANAATSPNTDMVTTGVRRIRIPLTKCQKQAQFQAGSTNGTNLFFLTYMSDSTLVTHPTFAFAWKVFFRDS